jgi:hypothetical protein
MNHIIGQKYWSCESAIESLEYGEQFTRPWQGILSGNDKRGWRLHRFNSETNQIDEDSNATAIIYPGLIFDTEQEAIQYYITLALEEATTLRTKALELENEALNMKHKLRHDFP